MLRTDADDGHEGHGFVFTIGRGNDVQVAAIEALRGHLVGRTSTRSSATWARVCRDLVHDSQLRWLGPEKGVMHMAIGAVVNALWDLAAKRAGLPLWHLLAELSPEELVDLVDFRYLTDALTPEEALAILRGAEPGRAERDRAAAAQRGYPAYTTTPGLARLLRREARAALPRGGRRRLRADQAQGRRRPRDDIRRLGIAREAVGRTSAIAIDANQRWDVAEAIELGERARRSSTRLDRGADQPRRHPRARRHRARRRAVRVATGEHVQNRVVFKQLLQAGGIDVLQLDAARSAGSTRTSRSCCWRRSSASRCARTPAASACASWCSTCRCSTSWPCPARSRTG